MCLLKLLLWFRAGSAYQPTTLHKVGRCRSANSIDDLAAMLYTALLIPSGAETLCLGCRQQSQDTTVSSFQSSLRWESSAQHKLKDLVWALKAFAAVSEGRLLVDTEVVLQTVVVPALHTDVDIFAHRSKETCGASRKNWRRLGEAVDSPLCAGIISRPSTSSAHNPVPEAFDLFPESCSLFCDVFPDALLRQSRSMTKLFRLLHLKSIDMTGLDTQPQACLTCNV